MSSRRPSPAELQRILRRGRPLLISFVDGDQFRLRNFVAIHVSVYGQTNQWSAEIDEMIAGSDRRKKLFRPGSGLDFLGADVVRIYDEAQRVQLFPKPPPNNRLQRSRGAASGSEDG
jgi:hypothetical protein